jgi:uncharacterized protein YodC (DUF2158 family)
MSDQIAVGSVVQLKSGGPKMTVSTVEPWNGVMTAFCDWFEGSNSKTNGFPVSSLKVVAEAASGPAIAIGKPGTWS